MSVFWLPSQDLIYLILLLSLPLSRYFSGNFLSFATSSLASCAASAGSGYFSYGRIYGVDNSGNLACDSTLTGVSGSLGGYCMINLQCSSPTQTVCGQGGVNPFTSASLFAASSSCPSNQLTIYQGLPVTTVPP